MLSEKGGTIAFKVLNDTVASTSVAPSSTNPTDSAPTTTVAPVVAPTDPTGSTTPSSGSGAPLGLFRFLHYLALASLFGGLVFLLVAWEMGADYLSAINHLRVVWVVATVSSFLEVGGLAARQSGAGLGSSLSPTAWGDAFATMPGKAAVLRFLLVAASGWVALRPSRVLDPTTQLASLALPGLAVLTLGVARDDYGFIEIVAGMVHALGMSVWLGGIVMQVRAVLLAPDAAPQLARG